MARTNIEEDTFGKLSKFAGRLGWSEREALGLLGLLWHDSQDEEVSLATKEEIFDFCRLYSEPEDEKNMIFTALVKSRFLIEKENNVFEIRGNAKQIKILRAYRDRTKKATEARLEKLSPEKNDKNSLGASQKHNVDVTSTLPARAQHETVHETQSKAKQGKSDIGNSQSLSPPKKKIFGTAEEFRDSLSIPLIEKGVNAFGEKMEEEVKLCFEYHSVDEQNLPPTKGKWAQKWLNWISQAKLRKGSKPDSTEPVKVLPSV